MIQPNARSEMYWRKSSRSQEHGACVEVAAGGRHRFVRDSKHLDGGVLALRHGTWRAFIIDIKHGHHDL